MFSRSVFRRAAVGALAILAARTAPAQDDRIRIFGSLNAGVGMVDNLPVQGLTKEGTTDYRILSLQFRFMMTEKDQFVTQLASRKVGKSVINDAYASIYPVWAFYQHRFDNGAVVKIGRTPLPRGVYNEVRYIGTLLPFYRVGESVYAETLENLDGITINKSWTAGNWGVDATFLTGGFDLNALLPGNDGTVSLVHGRWERALGTQLWLTTPIPGVRLGEFVARMDEDGTTDNRPYATLLHSFDGNWSRGFVKAELTEFRHNLNTVREQNFYRGWYTVAGVKPTEKLTVSVGHEEVTRRLNFPEPINPATIDLKATTENILGFAYAASSNVVFKLEGHAREGYLWDVAVPIVMPPTRPPFSMTVVPPAKGNFAIASVAITF